MNEFQLLILGLLVAIVFSLGKALVHMSRGGDESGLMVRALTTRIVLSSALFALLLAGWHYGWIAPHGVH